MEIIKNRYGADRTINEFTLFWSSMILNES